jgi:hypothetical protein
MHTFLSGEYNTAGALMVLHEERKEFNINTDTNQL